LAKKSSDITTTLIQFSQSETSHVMTDAVKAGLLKHLEDSSFSDPRDREIITMIGKYISGEIGASSLASLVDRERGRWGMPRSKPEPVRIPRPDPLRAPFTESQAKVAQNQWAEYLKVPVNFKNTLGMEMQLIPPGIYTMGSSNYSATGDTTPHSVTISSPLYVSRHELTLGQFRQFARVNNYRTEQQRNNWSVRGWDTGQRRFIDSSRFNWENPGWTQTDDHPVVHVSWNDGQILTNWLSFKEKETYRFLTEAEWEYCCRAGTTSLYATGGDDPSELVKMGNVLDNTGMQLFSSDYQFRQNNQNEVIPRTDGVTFTASVGQFKPNHFGLYDFHGNICEWCQDWYTTDYQRLPGVDPEGASSGKLKSARGGRFDTGALLAKSFYRNKGEPELTDMILGLRLAREIRLPE
jgi:formylglycine-generating enzyme required for sulfatase activity